MKTVIELLEDALDVMLHVTQIPESHQEIAYIKEAMAELKTPRWIPYKNLTAAHDRMSEAIKAVEEVTFRSRDEEKRIKTALNRIECAMGALETLIPLPLPRWETPEQYEKRTGKAWPDNGAVRVLLPNNEWDLMEWWRAKQLRQDLARLDKDFGDEPGDLLIVCDRGEAGPPPDGWQPESGETQIRKGVGE
jgi:hypothetical protein